MSIHPLYNAGVEAGQKACADQISGLQQRNEALRTALSRIGYFSVTNPGHTENGRPPHYYECKLCSDWSDEQRHIEHADSCPLHSSR